MLDINNNTRWKKAQKVEAMAWDEYSSSPNISREETSRESLNLICDFASLSEEKLRNMHILEIGGPRVESALGYVNNAIYFIMDPLFPFPRLVSQRDKPCHRIRGVGEYIPLPDKTMDLVWCENTIDHVFSPVKMLKEIYRVLDKSGMLVISCEIFPSFSKPLFPLFDFFDTPHPHHFTYDKLKKMLARDFEIQDEWEVKNKKLSLSQNLKNNVAVVIGVQYLYFRCTPL